MTDHAIPLYIFLASAVLIGGIFLVLYRSSLTAAENGNGMGHPGRKRSILALLLMAVLVILLSATLPRSPYYLYADGTPEVVVHVEAAQYNFNLSLTGDASYDILELPAGKLVEFRVQSKDVNHGFGIYDEHHALVAQIQAMPGYVNRLRWVFATPGTYEVLCLEYCGMSHHLMRSSFTVK